MSQAALAALQTALMALADPQQAQHLQRFFKTAPGEYGAGDRFLGIRVPQQRALVKEFHAQISSTEAASLLQSAYHECRLTALLLWIQHYQGGTPTEREQIYAAYLSNTARINSWDLVDTSAPHIVGEHLLERPRDKLYQLAHSASLWERRIAIVSCLRLLKNADFHDTLQLAECLLHDSEDLIHKAVGWLLRELGKRDLAALENFLQQHAAQMPRTMLRYALEKFPPQQRQAYLRR